MRSDTAGSPTARNAPDLDSDEASDENDNHEAGSRAGKRRRLVSVSCEICKQRKVKCDRGQPSCGWCARNGATCEYKERKRPGLRAGFGKELEERMDRLEAILNAHSEILESSLPPNQSGSRANSLLRGSDQGTPREPSHMYKPSTPQVDAALQLSRPSSYTTTSHVTDVATAAAVAASAASAANGPTAYDGFGLRPQIQSQVQPQVQPQVQSQMQSQIQSQVQGRNASSPLQLPPIQVTMTAPDAYAAAMTADPSASLVDMPLASDMPPCELLYTLVDLFFKHIHPWCPILHRAAILELLMLGSSEQQEADRILLHAIVATTMRYCTDPRLTRERRQHYYRIAKGRVLLYGMEHLSVRSLQALVILALDLCGSRNGPHNIMALLTRAVVQLGLAVETSSFSVAPGFKSIYTLRAMILAEPKDFIEEESRRRLFWMVYLLDRYATIATAFDFALSDREIDRRLPCQEEPWLQNQKVETAWFTNGGQDPENANSELRGGGRGNIDAFAYYMQVLGILSKIHMFLKQPVDISAVGDVERWKRQYKELDSMLASWMARLPSEFRQVTSLLQPGCLSKNVSCSWIMMQVTFHTAVIRLHSSAAYPTTRSTVFTPSAGAAHLCLRAVEQVASIAEAVVNNGILSRLGPPFAFTIWVCARLLLVHGSTVEKSVSPRISFFIDTLREIGRYWPVAARYCELLERVLDEHAHSQRQGGKEMPSSVRILSDMRRTAFDLDLLISRQPRQGPPSTRHASTPTDHTQFEYLDVFDFFNVPRLAIGVNGGTGHGAGGGGDGGTGVTQDVVLDGTMGGAGLLNEFNITNFMVDANSDWLFKDQVPFT